MAKKIKLSSEIIKIETNHKIQRINGKQRFFWKKINKMGKPLSKLTKRQRDNTQINTIRNEKEDITTDTKENPENLKYL